MVNKLKLALVLIMALSMLAINVHADTLFIEAETGTDSSMTIGSDSDAYGGKYIYSDELEKSITYKFTIEEAGKYLIWARVYATNDTDNSMFFLVDGQTLEGQENYVFDFYEPSEYEIAQDNKLLPDDFRAGDPYYGKYYWLPLSYRDVNVDPAIRFNYIEFDLKAGEHTLVMMPREAGARVDKLIITSDLSYDPTKISIDPEEQWAIDNAPVEIAEPEASAEAPVTTAPTPTVTAAQTSDSIVWLVFLSLAAVMTITLIAKKRSVR